MENSKEKRVLKGFITGFGLFLLFFLLMYMLRNRMHFNSDEYDNILGGMIIGNGGEVYKNFISQHTPLMYYLCALVYLLGVRTVIMYRLFMFAGLSLLWVIMFFRYRKHFGSIPMFIYPLSYIALMFTTDKLSHCILSEQVQSQALVILLLEFLTYTRIKNFKISNYFWISFSVLFSFGTAFVSIYPIFIIALGVLSIEIANLIKTGKSDKSIISKETKQFFVKGIVLVISCLVPFIILIIVYAVKGNIKNAVYGIYTVNRIYYPKYGGAESSILKSFLGPINVFKATMKNTGMFTVNLALISAMLYSIVVMRKKGIFRGIVCLGFIYMTAMRSMSDFHGLPFLSAGMCFFGLTVGEGISILKSNKDFMKMSRLKQSITVFSIVFILLSPFELTFLWEIRAGSLKFNKSEYVPQINKGSAEDVVTALIAEDEKFYDATITLLYVPTNRLPINAPGLVCPWIYEAYHDRIFETLENEKPKLIYLPDSFEVWGHNSKDFAADAYEYIRENYTSFESECGINGMYIINSYYENAKEIWSKH